jgi:predicted phage terminase large subunit-like protein
MVSRKQAAEEILRRRAARVSLLAFMSYVWWMPHPFIIGSHTQAVCARIDRAIEDYFNGISSFIDIEIPFRHGKSDIVSRALPAYFLGRCSASQPDVILTGYGDALVREYSKDVQRIINGSRYQALFPNVAIPSSEGTLASWSVSASVGRVTATGLGGAITGKGGNLIVVDDYCKSRAEARSAAYRQRVWDAFNNDILTRRGPAAIVIVCATPWHVDGMQARIFNQMALDPNFPQFDRMRFPARTAERGWLFPERYSEEWYLSQYAALGRFSSGLLDCEPTVEGGNRFKTERGVNIHIHDTRDGWPALREVRGWDLASSKKERDSDDPDSTWGVCGGVQTTSKNIQGDVIREHHIWISDAVTCREEAPARDALIRKTALADGPCIEQHVEAFGGYKDAFSSARDTLSGAVSVHKSQLPGDKSAKLAPLEPSFEAGHVHMLRGSWNAELIKQLTEFPDGSHDDACDALAVMFHACAGGEAPDPYIVGFAPRDDRSVIL